MPEQVMPLAEAVKHEQDQERLLRLLAFPNATAPVFAAQRRDINDPVMRRLACHNRPNVRLTLVNNNADRLPDDILKHLAEDIFPAIQERAREELNRRREAQGGAQ